MGPAAGPLHRTPIMARPLGLLLLAMAAATSTAADEPAKTSATLARAAKHCGVRIADVQVDLDVETPFGPITAKPAGSALAGFTPLLAEELVLYPPALMRRSRLKRVVLCSGLAFDGQPRGAVPDYWHDDLYLDVARGAFSPAYQRTAFHHEFFHFVDYRDDGDVYRDDAWSALNPPDFFYGPGGRNLQNDPSASLLTDKIPGFLTSYATSGVEEDKAEVFSRLILAPREVQRRADADPIVGRKVARMKHLLRTFDPSVDEAFWRRIAARPDIPVEPARPPVAASTSR